jgi:hypothetical protein
VAFSDLIENTDRAAQDHLGGVTVSYQPLDGDAVPVVGIFDENYRLMRPDNSGVEQVTPALFVRLEDLPVHPDDDEPRITIGGQVYKVRERQPDGVGGGVHLLLHKVDPSES